MAGDSSTSTVDEEVPRGCTCGSCILPFLVFVSFFCNFIYSDVGAASDKYDTLVSPPHFTFLIWIVIYVLEFAFVLYQLFNAKARNSSLIQRGIAVPYILHQVLTAAWLILFSREKIYESTAVITIIWILSLAIFGTIARSFRTGRYRFYSVTDFCFIEVPFAILLGWETLATVIAWNIFAVKLMLDDKVTYDHGISGQVLSVIITFSIIAMAAILFAGLPMLMDPFVHLPLIWGTFAIGWRWCRMQSMAGASHLGWASPPFLNGIGVASWFSCGVCGLFFLIAAIILGSSRLCLPDRDRTSSSQTSGGGSSRADNQQPRSPRTARSALSAERV